MTVRILPLAVAFTLASLVPAVPVRAHEGHEHTDVHAHGHGHADHAHDAPHAGADHHHEATHGGLVRTAGDHHLELLVHGQTVSLWVQDGDQHDLPVKGTQGKLIVKPAGQTAQVLALHPVGDHLEATLNLKGGGHHLPVVVQILHQGERLTARFVVDL